MYAVFSQQILNGEHRIICVKEESERRKEMKAARFHSEQGIVSHDGSVRPDDLWLFCNQQNYLNKCLFCQRVNCKDGKIIQI